MYKIKFKGNMNCNMINRKTIGEILRFGIVGMIATFINWGVYWILQHWIDVNISYSIGFALSFVCNYYLSSIFTFKSKANVKNGIGFLTAHVLSFLMRLFLLNLFIFIGVRQDIAPIPVDCVAVPVNFLLVRFAFKHK